MQWDDDYVDTKCVNDKCSGHTELNPETELYVCDKCGLVQNQARPKQAGLVEAARIISKPQRK